MSLGWKMLCKKDNRKLCIKTTLTYQKFLSCFLEIWWQVKNITYLLQTVIVSFLYLQTGSQGPWTCRSWGRTSTWRSRALRPRSAFTSTTCTTSCVRTAPSGCSAANLWVTSASQGFCSPTKDEPGVVWYVLFETGGFILRSLQDWNLFLDVIQQFYLSDFRIWTNPELRAFFRISLQEPTL